MPPLFSRLQRQLLLHSLAIFILLLSLYGFYQSISTSAWWTNPFEFSKSYTKWERQAPLQDGNWKEELKALSKKQSFVLVADTEKEGIFTLFDPHSLQRAAADNMFFGTMRYFNEDDFIHNTRVGLEVEQYREEFGGVQWINVNFAPYKHEDVKIIDFLPWAAGLSMEGSGKVKYYYHLLGEEKLGKTVWIDGEKRALGDVQDFLLNKGYESVGDTYTDRPTFSQTKEMSTVFARLLLVAMVAIPVHIVGLFLLWKKESYILRLFVQSLPSIKSMYWALTKKSRFFLLLGSCLLLFMSWQTQILDVVLWKEALGLSFIFYLYIEIVWAFTFALFQHYWRRSYAY